MNNQKINSRSNWKECFFTSRASYKNDGTFASWMLYSLIFVFIYHRSPESKWGQLWSSPLISLQVFVSVYVFLYKLLPSLWNTQPRLYRSELICLDRSDLVPKPITWSCHCFGCSSHDVIHKRELAITTRNDWPDLLFTFKTKTASIPHLTSETNPVMLFHYLL